jgi:hypothetical protein
MLLQDLSPATSHRGAGVAATRFDARTRALGGADCGPGLPARFVIRLEPGTYWVVALRLPTEPEDREEATTPAEPATITVSGVPTLTTVPEPDATAAASDARSWALPTVIPARGTLLLRNPGANGHSLRLERVPPGESAQLWLETAKLGRGVGGLGSARLSAGEEMLWIYDFAPGEYVAMDISIGGHGYPQPHGAGAVIVTLK